MNEEREEMNDELGEQIKLVMHVLDTLREKAVNNKYAFKKITITADIKMNKTGQPELIYGIDGLSGHKEAILRDLMNQNVIDQAENIKDIL